MKFSPTYEILLLLHICTSEKTNAFTCNIFHWPFIGYHLLFLYAISINAKPAKTDCYVLHPSSAPRNTAANHWKLVSTIKFNTRSRKVPSLILSVMSLLQFVYSWTFNSFNRYNLSSRIINTVKPTPVKFFWWFQKIRGRNIDKCAEWLFWLLVPEDKLTFLICSETWTEVIGLLLRWYLLF